MGVGQKRKILIDTNVVYAIVGLNEYPNFDLPKLKVFLKESEIYLSPLTIFEILRNKNKAPYVKWCLDTLDKSGGGRFIVTHDMKRYLKDAMEEGPLPSIEFATKESSIIYHRIGRWLCDKCGFIYSDVLTLITLFLSSRTAVRLYKENGLDRKYTEESIREITKAIGKLQSVMAHAISDELYELVLKWGAFAPRARDEKMQLALVNQIDFLGKNVVAGKDPMEIRDVILALAERADAATNMRALLFSTPSNDLVSLRELFIDACQRNKDNFEWSEEDEALLDDSFDQMLDWFMRNGDWISPYMDEFIRSKAYDFLGLETKSKNNDIVDVLIYESLCEHNEPSVPFDSIVTFDQRFERFLREFSSKNECSVLGLDYFTLPS